jgi:asparagine synthase (glutamine-hydrolysing)
MCGIVGIFHFDPRAQVDVDLLRRMNASIIHRGPDEDGFFVRGPLGMANRRLSIVGLADGRQPIANEDETVWTVFNGETYNYPDLREELSGKGHRFRTHTDTEVVVHAYEEDGPDFVHRLNGMFALALWDERRRKLFLYRDRLGEKPLYYTVSGGRLLFASEIKALLEDPGVGREISPEALSAYLTLQYNPGRQTIFRDVVRLRPGTMLEVSADGIQERTWWEVPAEPGPDWPEARWVEALRELLRDSVRRRLLADVPLGAFLSGGIDSSTVTALMAQLIGRPVETFSVGFRVPGAYDESEHAERVARRFGTEHRSLVVDAMDVERLLPRTVYHLDEPVADYAAIPTYLLSEFARRHVKVVLTGEGADELFAGYDHYRFPHLLGRYGRVPHDVRRLLSGIGARIAPPKIAKALEAGALDPLAGYARMKAVFQAHEIDALLAPDLLAARNGHDPLAPFAALFGRSGRLDPLNRYLLADLSTWLPEDLLMKVDKMSMSVSLEARVPFLDHRIVELVAGMPSSLKWGRERKHLLKRAVADLLPAEVLARPKHGFTLPLDRWFRGECREFATDLLLGERTRRRGFFRPSAVEATWQAFLAGRDGAFMRVWVLLNFEVWCRVFLDRERPDLR